MKSALPVLLFLTVIASGCLSKPPALTEKPKIDVSPWREHTATSEKSSETYTYLFANGPSEAAPSILLLHGGIFDQRMWLYMDGLSKTLNVYAMEWPNASPFYSGTVSDYAKVIDDFLVATGISELFIAGVSNGAYGAVEYAASEPEKVKALFLFSSVMLGITPEEVEERSGMAKRALGFKGTRLQRIIEWQVSRKSFAPAPGDVQLHDIYYTRPRSYYEQIFGVAANHGAERQATWKIVCPVLILHGEEDETMPVDVSRLAAEVFNDAEFKSFEDQEHSFVFNYGEELVPVVLDFLKSRGLI